MKKFFVLFAIALCTAAVSSFRWQPTPFEERVIALRLDLASPELATALANEPIDVKAMVLDYADDRILLLKAQSALARYPELARDVLPLYGDTPEFKEILLAHGDSILAPIHYFLKNEVFTTALMHKAKQKALALQRSAKRISDTDKKATAAQTQDTRIDNELTAEQRGWYAIDYIRNEGHDFLGQFVMDDTGKPRWIQSERALEMVTALFSGGIKDLEIKIQTNQTPTAEDVGWATVDAFVALGTVKLLQLGRATSTTGKSIGLSTRAAALTSSLARANTLSAKIIRYGKWPAIGVASYVAFHQPGIISDGLADLANLIGIPAWLGIFLGWTLILLPGLYIGVAVIRLAVNIAQAMLRAVQGFISWLEYRKQKFPIDLRYTDARSLR